MAGTVQSGEVALVEVPGSFKVFRTESKVSADQVVWEGDREFYRTLESSEPGGCSALERVLTSGAKWNDFGSTPPVARYCRDFQPLLATERYAREGDRWSFVQVRKWPRDDSLQRSRVAGDASGAYGETMIDEQVVSVERTTTDSPSRIEGSALKFVGDLEGLLTGLGASFVHTALDSRLAIVGVDELELLRSRVSICPPGFTTAPGALRLVLDEVSLAIRWECLDGHVLALDRLARHVCAGEVLFERSIFARGASQPVSRISWTVEAGEPPRLLDSHAILGKGPTTVVDRRFATPVMYVVSEESPPPDDAEIEALAAYQATRGEGEVATMEVVEAWEADGRDDSATYGRSGEAKGDGEDTSSIAMGSTATRGLLAICVAIGTVLLVSQRRSASGRGT